jgi:hypothetical protein
MFEETKCDLSYQHAKLDYPALESVARIAVGSCLESISKNQAIIRDAQMSSNSTKLHCNAHWLLRDAKHLVIASEVLAALIGGRSREVVEIVNKPEITE